MAHPKAELVRKEYEEYERRVDAGEPFPTVIADMIADLMHLGDAMAEATTDEGEEWDPDEAVDRAMGHYVAERDGDDIELSSRESGYGYDGECGDCADKTEGKRSSTCTVCHEAITRDEDDEWVHSDGDKYCGTGDGAMALPEDDDDD